MTEDSVANVTAKSHSNGLGRGSESSVVSARRPGGKRDGHAGRPF